MVFLRPGSGLRALDCGLCLGGCAGADEPMSGEPLELHDEGRHVPRLPRCLGMACRCACGQCLKYRRLLQNDVMMLLQECCARLASPPVLQAPSQRHARLLPKSSFPLSLPILATYLGAREMNDGLLFGLQPQYPRVCGEGLLLDDASPPHVLSSASVGTSLKFEETFRFHSERPQPNQPHSTPQQRLSPKTSPHTSLDRKSVV